MQGQKRPQEAPSAKASQVEIFRNFQSEIDQIVDFVA